MRSTRARRRSSLFDSRNRSTPVSPRSRPTSCGRKTLTRRSTDGAHHTGPSISTRSRPRSASQAVGVATSLRRSERITRIASPAATVTNPATEASKKTLHTTSSDFAFEISGPPTASPTIPTRCTGDDREQDGPPVPRREEDTDRSGRCDRRADQDERPLHRGWHAGSMPRRATRWEPRAHDGHSIDTPSLRPRRCAQALRRSALAMYRSRKSAQPSAWPSRDSGGRPSCVRTSRVPAGSGDRSTVTTLSPSV